MADQFAPPSVERKTPAVPNEAMTVAPEAAIDIGGKVVAASGGENRGVQATPPSSEE
jgi:hypothetical protein